MIKKKLAGIKSNIVLMIMIISFSFIFSSCIKTVPSETNPELSSSPSIVIEHPTESSEAIESDYIQFDMLMHYQNGIQVIPEIYESSSISLKASDGYEVQLDLLQSDDSTYPVYYSRQNETLNTPLIKIPNTDNNQYILWNQHKIYLIDLSVPNMDILLEESDEDTTYAKSLEGNQANGLYWGTKPVLSEDGHYLLYLTNRRNNGKTNDIRLYDFETKEDVLLSRDSYYNDAYISDTTVFYTCNDMLARVEISSNIKAIVSYSISSNGSFCYPYYIYSKDYYQNYEILNILTLNVEKGSLGSEKSALKILPIRTDVSNIAAIILLDQQKVTLSFVDIRENKLLKTFVLSESLRIIYTQWKDNNTFLISGYEGGTNEKTYLLSY